MSHIDRIDDTMRQIADLDRRIKLLENPKLQLGSALSGARWQGDDTGIRAYDGTATNYGAPSGAGVTTEITAAGLLFAAKLLLQTAGSGARIVLDSSVPIVKLIDPNGVTRVEYGSLSSNGVSAGGWKIRVNDAAGNPIFDSDGLIQVMNLLGAGDISPQEQTITGNGAWQDLPQSPSSVSVAVPRDTHVLVLATAQLGINTGSLGEVRVTSDVSGATSFAYMGKPDGSNWPGTTVHTSQAIHAVPAGTYSFKLQFNYPNTVTGLVRWGHFDAYNLGS